MHRPIRSIFAIALLAAFAPAIAGCGGTVAPSPKDSEGRIGPSGSAGSSGPGKASIAVSGAKQLTLSKLGSCTANTAIVSAIYEAQIAGVLYLFQITTEQPKAGDVALGRGVSTTVAFSDSAGDTWESDQAGASGKLTIDAGLRSGAVDAKLVNPVDKTTVGAKGTWTCGG